MKEVRWFFSFASLLILTLTAKCGRSEFCQSNPEIDLNQIELDLMWIEPGHFGFISGYKYLANNRTGRLEYFQNHFGTGFKKSRVTMARMTDERTNLDCLKVFTPENGGAAALAKEQPAETTVVGSNQKAALLATRHFPAPPSRDTVVKNPVLRAVVLFTEEGPTHPEPNNGPPFRGDETDTCASNFPTSGVVTKVFSEKEIIYLVISESLPSATAFKFEYPESTRVDNFFHDVLTILLNPNGFVNADINNEITTWVNKTLKKFACTIYSQKMKTPPSALSTSSALPMGASVHMTASLFTSMMMAGVSIATASVA